MFYDERLNGIVNEVNGLTDKIALFGSSLYCSKNNDIDILIFTDKKNIVPIRKKLYNNKKLHPIYIEKRICSYTGIRDVTDDEDAIVDKPIHISFIPEDENEYINTSLWKENHNKMRFIMGKI